ncbi:phage tail protein [Alteromonadaceae bacterium M269]|nr:phage tail protein [Alteromonadaceae bacterium M269]
MSRQLEGVTIGLVTDLEDPEQLGRIKVKYTLLDGEPSSHWARIATPMASSTAGMFFQPEIDDEALVVFESGNMSRPYVIGFLWNGSNKPPEDAVEKRTLKTISGHTLVFDDTEGEENITIIDKNENIIVMHQDGIDVTTDKTMLLKGQEVTVEASGQLTLKGNPIHMNP